MNKKEKELYIRIRAEQIKDFQDRHNGHLMKEPYSMELAKEIAETQLNEDLYNNRLRISLEELLLNTDSDCIDIIQNRQIEYAKQIFKAL